MTDQLIDSPSRRTFFRGLGVAGAAAVTGAAASTLATPSATAAPVPGFNHEISRDEVIKRAHAWVDDPRPYSMESFDVGPEQDPDILWRQDCSGFVSMALAIRFDDNPTGLTTETLHPDGGFDVSDPITKDELLPGDFILQRNADSSSGVGHVVLFNGWVEGGYNVLEQASGAGGTTSRTATYPYDDLPEYHPFRYRLIVD
ncbi:hypothetical protein [Brachybacterium sacelli]|uniref:Cell wall-associated hydrolase n=1 Tax=Brachybacterium sacelli TaxID=173364 RepID=A0ABS4WYD1_9MICO|nr:hypothetical protein [Brachybacterium sacelli]MBP2381214.1 hypothetical protein [Brachybacterium sacelli]